ncbi:hypothetical protein AJ80_02513 [Polytolypa hystricis UAMH7299]|uniref:alpha-D-xyloside xylohydrolase n=1 Tax=Polytolypa hystricis (strain UAMH7299) TaxID=1447883 RepID=A0A2B7YQY5_POLH7|nr:hypothetical protein AJ80_02513 [Polytolypa hystricis UAMH7299]
MKFTEGMWRLKDGIHIDWMGNVEKITEPGGGDLRLLLTKPLRQRGDTLNSPTITTRISSPAEDVIGVKYVHWAGDIDKGPHYELSVSTPKTEVSRESPDLLSYRSGNLSLLINTEKNAFQARFVDNDGEKLTSHSFRSVGYVTDEKKAPFEDGLFRERQGFMLAEFDLGVHEHLYGLGERFGPFVKKCSFTPDMSNEDGGTSSQLAYKNIPFYISSKGYGVFVNHPGLVSFELQSERTTRVNISVPGENIEYFVIYGPTPTEILQKYTALTGRPAVPPAWSYNLWLTTSFTTSYDEKTVTGFLDGFRDRKIPLGTFHFDCFWMKGFQQWCDFEFDPDMFPDAAGFLARLKQRGLNICVWINPYIAQESALFEEGKKQGYLVKRTNGGVWQWDNWQAGMGLVDFTNPAACEWYKGHLSRLVKMGVTAFKTDFGERIPRKNITYFDGSDPERMHNYYTHLFNKTVHEVILTDVGPTQGCLFARSATAGGQQFPVHWGGDCESTFEAMAETLRGGLSASLSGLGFWAHDIGGFEGTPSPALYKRWCQFGLLSSHSRLHGSSSYRVPWQYDEESCDVLRDCVNRKLSLMPYLLKEALAAHRSGTPIMRPTFFEYPEDYNTYPVDTQYFFGSNLLVAPVFSESGKVRFYVPESEGTWVSWFDRQKHYQGGKWYTETHSFFSLPLLIRPGTVTATNPTATEITSDVNKDLELIINGPIKEKLVLDIVDPDQPDNVQRTISVLPEGSNKLMIEIGEIPATWTVLYCGQAKGGSYEKGVTKFSSNSPKLAIQLS